MIVPWLIKHEPAMTVTTQFGMYMPNSCHMTHYSGYCDEAKYIAHMRHQSQSIGDCVGVHGVIQQQLRLS